MSDNVGLFHQYLAAFNERRFDDVAMLIDPDIVDHHLPPEVPAGADGVLSWLRLLADTMTIQVENVQTVDGGNIVAGHGWISGTHIGDFPGLPATGRDFRVAISSIERFENGKVVERWETFDSDLLMTQLTG